MDVKNIRLDELKPYEKNPRKNNSAVEAVAKSIKEFGWRVPLVIDADNVIVAGHTRYKAAQKLGLETVPCVVADDLTPEQIKAYRLIDNKTAELASWEVDDLNAELAELTGFDMQDFGFEVASLTDIQEPQQINSGVELKTEDFADDRFKHTCPKCGFKF